MKQQYHYFMSSRTQPKHEITRKEFVKLLGESNHCVDVHPIVNGLSYSVANYDKAERETRNAQRRTGGSLWSCGGFTLYLEKERQGRRMRDSRYPD